MKVYHLSFNKDLPNVLKPKQPYGLGTNKEHFTYEDLPERTSFSPTIKECWYAIYQNVKHYFNDGQYKYPYLNFYVYSANITSDTKIIDEETMMARVHDYYKTKEVAVTEPIEVELVGKVRIYNNEDARNIYYYPFNNTDNGKRLLATKPIMEIIENYNDSRIAMEDSTLHYTTNKLKRDKGFRNETRDYSNELL